MERDIEYEQSNIVQDIKYTEEYVEGIKCKNYKLCETVLPKWWFELKCNYLCSNCRMMFGTWKNETAGIYKTGKGQLDISDNKECPICLEVKTSISHPNCDHTLCVDCFKRCYYGDDDLENEPKFPYSKNIEDEYDDESYDEAHDVEFNGFPDYTTWLEDFKQRYPLIEMWIEEWNKWADDQELKYENEKYLRKCTLCRV